MLLSPFTLKGEMRKENSRFLKWHMKMRRDRESRITMTSGGRLSACMDTHPVRVGRENIMRQEVKGASPGFHNAL